MSRSFYHDESSGQTWERLKNSHMPLGNCHKCGQRQDAKKLLKVGYCKHMDMDNPGKNSNKG